MKKKVVYFLVVFFITSYLCGAQDSLRRESAIESLKIGFITKRINLTPEEAQKFWPVYNKYSSELKSVRHKPTLGEDVLVMEERVLNIRKKYKSEFLKVISQDRLNEFYKSELDFMRFLHKNLDNRRQKLQRP
jgi:hypothetical protein